MLQLKNRAKNLKNWTAIKYFIIILAKNLGRSDYLIQQYVLIAEAKKLKCKECSYKFRIFVIAR